MSVYARLSQGGEGLQSVEGSGSNGGQLVVVQRQQADVVQPCETVVVDTADLVVPQHSEIKKNIFNPRNLKYYLVRHN